MSFQFPDPLAILNEGGGEFMNKFRRYMRRALLLFVALFPIVAFQNCTQNVGFSSQKEPQRYFSGNGDGYSGKIGLFRHFDTTQPCAQADRLGNPLPNSQIFYQWPANASAKSPHLVRSHCRDIAPIELQASEIQFSPGSDSVLTYDGKTFNAFEPPGDFDVVANACPVGKTPMAGAVRSNLLVSSLDWTLQTSSQGWIHHQGISVNLNGSIESLPGYMISRNDPNALDGFRRASQVVDLQPSTDYAYSFLARAGSINGASFRMFRGGATQAQNEGIVADFNFLTGVASVRDNANMPSVTVAIAPVANGYLCTVYFRTSVAGDQSQIELGVSPLDQNYIASAGDSIVATAAQLEPINGFCQ